MFPDQIIQLAEKTIVTLKKSGLMIVTAESCTGGLIAAALTEIPGSSAVVEGGFVTYANAAKISMLGVPENMIARFGAVSQQVARAMAEGALKAANADIAIAVTGIAGPDGGTAEKPVGLVHFAMARPGETRHMQMRFGAIGRNLVRLATLETALEMLITTLALQP